MKIRYIALGIVLCISLQVFVYTVNHKYGLFGPFFTAVRQPASERREGGGVFTNPLLECVSSKSEGPSKELRLSETELADFVKTTTEAKKVDIMSVYVRDLNNGPWIGVNEEENFLGSSLLKVPILISYMDAAQDDPAILQKTIRYDKKVIDGNQYYNASRNIEVGTTYTVGQLLEYMIGYSDNNAANLLLGSLDESQVEKTFTSFGLPVPGSDEPYPVNVKNYASFFRILFNASYLNREYSEKSLEILSHTEFNRGIQALIPKNVIVSHKFGIRSDGTVNQLHDCGIVYYPNRPYLLCIMSRGGTFDDMAESIAEVSKFIYDQIYKNDSLR